MSDQLPVREEKTPEGLVAKWNPFEDDGQFAIQTSLPGETKEERAAVIALRNAESQSGGDLINAQFEISHYLAHPVTLENTETGDIVTGVRLVFPQSEGPPVAFVSLGVLKSLGELSYVTGRQPPWDPPIIVRLRQKSARGGRRIFKLEYVSG
jgi:hypothetical protein